MDKLEPVAWVYPDGFEALQNRKCWTVYGTHQNGMMRPLYAAPPKKEWVGLTDAEVEKVFFDMGQFAKIDLKTFARAIEAKLKEKNAND